MVFLWLHIERKFLGPTYDTEETLSYIEEFIYGRV